MKLIRTIPSLILIALGSIFCIASLRLGMGQINAPGPGFVPFIGGAILILFSLFVILFETKYENRCKTESKSPVKQQAKVILFILVPLFVYALVMDLLGFIVATFVIMFYLFKAPQRQSWRFALGASLLTLALTYFLFDYFLKVNLPKGFLGF